MTGRSSTSAPTAEASSRARAAFQHGQVVRILRGAGLEGLVNRAAEMLDGIPAVRAAVAPRQVERGQDGRDPLPDGDIGDQEDARPGGPGQGAAGTTGPPAVVSRQVPDGAGLTAGREDCRVDIGISSQIGGSQGSGCSKHRGPHCISTPHAGYRLDLYPSHPEIWRGIDFYLDRCYTE